ELRQVDPVHSEQQAAPLEYRHLAGQFLHRGGVIRGRVVAGPEDQEGSVVKPLELGQVLRVEAVLHHRGRQAEFLGGGQQLLAGRPHQVDPARAVLPVHFVPTASLVRQRRRGAQAACSTAAPSRYSAKILPASS